MSGLCSTEQKMDAVCQNGDNEDENSLAALCHKVKTSTLFLAFFPREMDNYMCEGFVYKLTGGIGLFHHH
jgi:hypothetical protein